MLSRILSRPEFSSASTGGASDSGTPTGVICGRKCSESCEEFDLQSCLESKSRAMTEGFGSPEYELRWKTWGMALGLSISALRASARRTSGSDCSGRQLSDENPAGWPTPDATAFEARDIQKLEERRARCKEQTGNGNGFGLTLGQAVPLLLTQKSKQSSTNTDTGLDHAETAEKHPDTVDAVTVNLAGWTTPQANEPSSPTRPSRTETGRTTDYLSRQVMTTISEVDSSTTIPTGWPTPKAQEDGRTLDQYEAARIRGYENRKGKTSGGPASAQGGLAIAVQLSGWPTPMAGTPATEENSQAGNSDYSRKVESLAAGWATPAARDFRSEEATEEFNRKRDEQARGKPLSYQVTLTGCSTPLATDGDKADCLLETVLERVKKGQQLSVAMESRLTSGETASSSPAATESTGESRGCLNPAFSGWLMGYPKEWFLAGKRAAKAIKKPKKSTSTRSKRKKSKVESESCGDTATPSSPK